MVALVNSFRSCFTLSELSLGHPELVLRHPQYVPRHPELVSRHPKLVSASFYTSLKQFFDSITFVTWDTRFL